MWRTLLFDDFAVPAPLAYVFSLSLSRSKSFKRSRKVFSIGKQKLFVAQGQIHFKHLSSKKEERKRICTFEIVK